MAALIISMNKHCCTVYRNTYSSQGGMSHAGLISDDTQCVIPYRTVSVPLPEYRTVPQMEMIFIWSFSFMKMISINHFHSWKWFPLLRIISIYEKWFPLMRIISIYENHSHSMGIISTIVELPGPLGLLPLNNQYYIFISYASNLLSFGL